MISPHKTSMHTTLAAALVAGLGAAAPQPASAQMADGEMLLAVMENCLAWANAGFPDETPFDTGFMVETPFMPGGTGTYGHEGTGMRIEVSRDGDAAACRTVGDGADVGPEILQAALDRLEQRADAGRVASIGPMLYVICDDPRGLLDLRPAEESEGLGVDIRWGDAVADQTDGACSE